MSIFDLLHPPSHTAHDRTMQREPQENSSSTPSEKCIHVTYQCIYGIFAASGHVTYALNLNLKL